MITTGAIGGSNLQFFFSQLNTGLRASYADTPITYDKICSIQPSDTEQNIYGMITRIQKARLWAGPRVVDEPNPFTRTLVNLPFEKTMSIDRFRLEDSQGIKGALGIYWPAMADMALQLKRWPDIQTRDWLQAKGAWSSAGAQLGLDGVTQWSTAHPTNLYNLSQPTYINDFTAGGQVVTYTKPNGSTGTVTVGGGISPNAVATLCQYMRGIQAEDGEPLGAMASALLHPAGMMQEVGLILKASFFAPPAWGTITGQVGAADNIMREYAVTPICWDLLDSDPTTFYMLDLTKAFKPFIFQLREAPQLVSRTAENDPVVFDSHRFLWGAWMRGAIMGNYPWLAQRSGP